MRGPWYVPCGCCRYSSPLGSDTEAVYVQLWGDNGMDACVEVGIGDEDLALFFYVYTSGLPNTIHENAHSSVCIWGAVCEISSGFMSSPLGSMF